MVNSRIANLLMETRPTENWFLVHNQGIVTGGLANLLKSHKQYSNFRIYGYNGFMNDSIKNTINKISSVFPETREAISEEERKKKLEDLFDFSKIDPEDMVELEEEEKEIENPKEEFEKMFDIKEPYQKPVELTPEERKQKIRERLEIVKKKKEKEERSKKMKDVWKEKKRKQMEEDPTLNITYRDPVKQEEEEDESLIERTTEPEYYLRWEGNKYDEWEINKAKSLLQQGEMSHEQYKKIEEEKDKRRPFYYPVQSWEEGQYLISKIPPAGTLKSLERTHPDLADKLRDTSYFGRPSTITVTKFADSHMVVKLAMVDGQILILG